MILSPLQTLFELRMQCFYLEAVKLVGWALRPCPVCVDGSSKVSSAFEAFAGLFGSDSRVRD